MSRVTRRPEIRRRRKRHATLRRLKARLVKAKSSLEVEKIMNRLRKVSLAVHLRELTKGDPTHRKAA